MYVCCIHFWWLHSMKNILRFVAIVLFALIVAAVYEIFYLRGWTWVDIDSLFWDNSYESMLWTAKTFLQEKTQFALWGVSDLWEWVIDKEEEKKEEEQKVEEKKEEEKKVEEKKVEEKKEEAKEIEALKDMLDKWEWWVVIPSLENNWKKEEGVVDWENKSLPPSWSEDSSVVALLNTDKKIWTLSADLLASSLITQQTGSIRVFEFCHYGSAICKELSTQWVVEDVISLIQEKKYSYSHQLYPFVKGLSESEHLIWKADECLKQKAPEKLKKFHSDLRTIDTTSSEKIMEMIWTTWVPWIDECVSSWSYWLRLRSIMTQAKSMFDLSRVPSIVVLNADTWEWLLIPGLYPTQEIIVELEKSLFSSPSGEKVEKTPGS